jgi:hypothetical protein
MKCRGKLALEHPNRVNPGSIGGCSGCPHDYGYLERPDWCDLGNKICTKCWDREIPGTEPTKTYEHDGCLHCAHVVKEETDEPCVRCNGTAKPYSTEYQTRPDLFEPSGQGEPIDIVNHPPHYTNGIECIDEMLAVFGNITVADFCLCNVWKYRKRALHKNGQEDLDKADWYMRKYIELTGTPEMMTKLP